MNPEIEASDRHLPGASTVSTEAQDCVKLFCMTLDNLNKIYSEQVKALINIAISVMEAAVTISSKTDERVKTPAGQTDDKLVALVDQLRSTAASSSQSNIDRKAEMTADAQNASNPEFFCGHVQYAILMAMANSVEQQDQLAVTGQAVVTMGVAKLFSLPVGRGPDST